VIARSIDTNLERLPEDTRRAVVDFLHGKWLGHPLHPILTDLPLGAWGFAGLVDLLSIGDRRTKPAADAAIAFGIATAVPTAISGALDWRQTGGEPRRIGTAHALLNTVALSTYVLSMLRRPNHGGSARFLSFAGYGIVCASAYLGGHLVMAARIGTKHESEATGPQQQVEVMDEASLREDAPASITANGVPVLLVKRQGTVYALADICPHLGCLLSEGRLEGDTIVCGCHGSTFALKVGKALTGPSTYSIATYKATSRDGSILVGPVDEE
jgi:nitrite reductase/ring-hydroxylating ferredoxin subunit/uncharacterized membrane protein